MEAQNFSPKGPKDDVTKFKIIKNLVMISTSFTFLFIAYDGLSMLQSTINKKDGIGVTTQAVGYIMFCVTSLFIPKYVIKKMGCKFTIVASVAVYLPYIAANFYPRWITMLPTALFIGSGAATLWGAQSTYFNECAHRYRDLIKKEEKAKLSSSEQDDASNNNEERASSKDVQTEKFRRLSSLLEILSEDNLKARLVKGDNSDDIKSLGAGYTNYGAVISDYDDVTAKRNSENKLLHQDDAGKDSKLPSTAIEEAARGAVAFSKPDAVDMSCGAPQTDPAGPRQRSESIFHKTLDTVTSCSTLETLTARFFSCHALAFYVAQILSNVMTYYILMYDYDADDDKPFGCACGASYCNSDPTCFDDDDEEEISDKTRYILSGSCLAVATLGVFLVLFFLDPVENNFRGLKEKEPVELSVDLALATIKHCKKSEQLFLIPMDIYIGMLQGFYTADLTKSYVACAWGTSYIGEVSIVFGVACFVGATLSGYVVKYIGRVPIFLAAQLLNVGMFVFLLTWIPSPSVPYKFFVAAALFGLITGLIWAQSLAFHGLLFKDEQEAAFASYYLFSSMGWTTSFLYSDHICTWIKIYILLAMSFIGTAGYLVTEYKFRKRKKFIKDMSL